MQKQIQDEMQQRISELEEMLKEKETKFKVLKESSDTKLSSISG